MNSIILLLIQILFLSALFGCNYNRVKVADNSNSENNLFTKTSSVTLDYNSIKSTVLDSACLNCHSNTGGNQGGLNLESYSQVKAASSKIYYRSIELKNMPPQQPLDENAFDNLKDWLEQGAPEKSFGKKKFKLSGPLNWAAIQELVIQPNCLNCHAQPEPIKDLDLSSYEIFKTNINKIIDRVIVKQDMPLSPYPNLSAQEKELFLKWISAGMPQ